MDTADRWLARGGWRNGTSGQHIRGRASRVWRVTLALIVTMAWAILPLVGCKRDVPEAPASTSAIAENTEHSAQALAFDGGPSCSGGGSPTTGVDAGASAGSCTGSLAQSTFVNGVCSCEGLNVSGAFTVDGFNSTEGGPNGGAGGSVGVNGTQTWSNTVSITGKVVTKGSIFASGTGRIRGDLRVGGMVLASAPLAVDGNAYSVQTLPASVQVAGTKTHVSSVAAPCDCTNVVPIASIVAAHRGTANDNASIGLSANAATGSVPSQIHLPCGNYYLTQINASTPLTITAHGKTALYIDGNVAASGTLTFAVDTAAGATLDLFIAGSLNSSNTLVLGSTARPATCRAYVAGPTLAMSSTSTIGCNVYAPSAILAGSGPATTYGALFVKSFNASGPATVHYDTSIQNAGGECCSQATCDDNNPCTVDSCNGNGTCNHTAATNGTACNDGNSCTQSDTCQAGVCTGANPITCAASDECHSAGTCNPATGVCSNPVVANGTTCSDGNACTQSDTCQAGVCTGANPVTCAASDQCHTAGTCDPANGTCSNPVAANGTACSDGNACTQSDTCQAGTCTGANPVTCVASDQCHGAGLCDPASGACTNPALPNGTACSDGNACTQSDTCQAGTCTGTNPVTCAASDQCHTAGTCDPANGACSNPIAANGTTCSDGNACTQSDSCQAGTCTGANPVTCTASDQCHTTGTCDPANGACSNPIAANGTTCNDGDACTQSDTCQTGVCTGANPVTCAASDQCHTAGTCDPANGACSNPIAANGTTCSDGNACTQSDSCQAGTCTGANPVTCAASDQCHSAGTCDPASGACSNPVIANGTTCDDGNACTQSDTCQTGVCTGANPVTCTASDQCHAAGACEPGTGTCSNPAVADGTACNDGSACTQSDTCQTGVCTGANPVTCTASDQCHAAGTCDPTTGTCSDPVAADGTTCSDGNGCTQTDRCQSGACVGSNPVQCTAVDACHEVGTCDSATGVCSSPLSPSCPLGIPPDPATIAPPLDRTVVTTIFAQTQFLYTGENAIQTGVPAGTIEVKRAAALHGRVLRKDLTPLPGVVVTIPGHPEYGQTATRADGRYDFVVNGGATLTLDFARPTYLPAQRDAVIPWNQFVKVPDVILLQPDPNVTVLEVDSPTYQVARGSVETDADGTRQGVALIPSGTLASAVMPDGSTVPLDNMSLRITEYTVGEHGPERMPGALPPNSAYTYAFEIAADEAMAAGATGVQFNQPIVYYVDNFLNFPTGTDVPVGSYDRSCSSGSCASGDCSGWAVENNGRVIAIVGISSGVANLDVDGDGVVDTGAKLTALAITLTEQEQIAQLYAPGKSLWRVLLPHLSAWDCNWGWGPPADAIVPNSVGAVAELGAQCCTDVGGARVDALSQTATESQSIAGTPYSLVYQSDRVAGHSGRTVVIPLTGDTLPTSVTRVDLEINVAGRTFEHSFPPSTNLSYTFEWDGLDEFGRRPQGGQPIGVHISFVYKGTYQRTTKFGSSGNGFPISGNPTRMEVMFSRDDVVHPASFDMEPIGLGGWDVNVHHPFDPNTAVSFGECSSKPAFEAPVVDPFAGGGGTAPNTGVPALQANLYIPQAIATAPDGSVYYVDRYNPAIYKIGTDGIMTRVAGTKVAGYNGDEIAATSAQINPADGKIAFARDCDGGFYFVDASNYRVRYVDRAGIIHTVAGTGSYGFTVTGGRATQSPFLAPRALAVAPDGSLYVSDTELVLRIGPDGILTRIAGTRTGPFEPRGSSADGISALLAWVDTPGAFTVGADGTLFLVDSTHLDVGIPRLRQIRSDGIITTIAGGGTVAPREGLDARSAKLSLEGVLALAPDGTHYIRSGRQLWAVRPDGKLHLVAGNGGALISQTGWSGTAATSTPFDSLDIALGPDGSLYSSEAAWFIRRVSSSLAGVGLGQYVVPSRDGREVYIYDGNGRHLRTIDALTNATRLSFGYDAGGRLASITDGAGNATTITHDASGHPTGIIAPRGQVTSMTTGEDGFLASTTNPASETFGMTYAPGRSGLLTSYADPAGHTSRFGYDGQGRLSHYDDDAGGALTLAMQATGTEYAVTQSTALGQSSSYTLEVPVRGLETKTTTLASGKMVSQSLDAGGAQVTKLLNGATTTVAPVPDPRFGMRGPLAGTITALTPGGLSFQQTLSRAVTLSDPTNVFSLVSLTDTTTVDATSNLRFLNTYTASTRTFAMTTPAGRARNEKLDTLGRLSSVQRNTLTATTFGYDTLGRLASIAQGTRARSYTYDTAGMLKTVTDPALKTTSFERDAVGRVVAETFADGQVAAFGYDLAGALASMTPPGRPAHAFTHSATGKLTTYAAPSVEGQIAPTTRWTYDADGRLATFVHPDGAGVALGYDTSGRVARATSVDGTISFTYDASTSRLGTATTPAGEVVTYSYDGPLTKQIAWTGPVSGDVQWGYDKFQKPVWETVNGSFGVGYAYDADGLVTRAGTMVMTRSSTTGLLTGTTLGNVTDTFTYDAFGAPATYVAKSLGATVFSLTTTRDALGRLATLGETVQGQTNQYVYTYDARGRLTDVTKNGTPSGHFVYDANGNRTEATTSNGAAAATFDAQDRLLTSGTFEYTYGAAGEVLSKKDTSNGALTSYAYDAFGNLTQVSLPTGKTIEYVLDAAGRRIAKKVDGVVLAQWIYRDSRRPIAELDGIGTVLRRFVYADSDVADKSVLMSIRERFGISRGSSLTAADLTQPTYIMEGAQVLRVITDQLGSTRLVIDATTGAVVQSVTYDVWGALTNLTGTYMPTFGFAGGLYDPDTGLVHLGAREYDPRAARWMSKEPMKNSGTLNFYQYAGGDPVNAVDPEGLAKATAPDKQKVLDSICGPDAEGEVACNVDDVEDALEKFIAEQGAAVAAETDTTEPAGQPYPTTDLPVLPIDGSGTTSSGSVSLGGGSAPVNQPPVVNVNVPNQAMVVTMPANNVALSGTVTDDGLPAGYGLQKFWYTQSGPADAVFAADENPATTVSFPVPGVYRLVLQATDGEYGRAQVLVVYATQAPTVTATGPSFVALTDTAQLVATATSPGLLPGLSIWTAWHMLSGPGTVNFTSPSSLTTGATFSAPGDYVLQFEATDSYRSSFARVAITVVQSNQAPIVSAGADQTVAAPAMAATLAGSATDDGQPVGSTLSYAWNVVSGPAVVTLATPNAPVTGATFTYPGAYVFQLAVSDGEKIGTATTTVNVGSPLGEKPVVSFTGLADDAVITEPVDVLASITEGSWSLEYRRGGRDDVEKAWTVLASGSGAVNGGKIATFDPTLLLNGFYTVRLSASTTAGETSSTVGVAVDGRMKVGLFTLTFTDLESVVGNMPFEIQRTYDSRDKDVGDFGVGWNLSLRNVRVEKSGKIGAYWTQTVDSSGFFSRWCLQPAQASTITVTFPGGRQYRFRAKASPQCQWLENFTSTDLVFENVSDPDNKTIKLTASQQSAFVSGSVGPVELWDGNLDVLDSKNFTLTTEDGTRYDLDQDLGVRSITDVNGNSLTVTETGIWHSSGKNVQFVRDAKGRITKITDPAGSAIAYEYDAKGDLIAHTDATLNRTTFGYVANHYLQDIFDPLGRRPIRSEYDEDGRLVKQTDAAGNFVAYTHNLSSRSEIVQDRLGHVTAYEYNDKGDITQKTDAAGGVWQYTFDSHGNQLTEKDPLGHLTRRTFNSANDVLTETDALGNVTGHTYNRLRREETSTDARGFVTKHTYDYQMNRLSTEDALGNKTTFGYDWLGNKTSETDALGKTTTYAYDAQGQITKKTDALGRVTNYTYDANGRQLTETTTRTNSGQTQTLLTTYEYDAAGRLKKTTYPDLTFTTTEYSPTGKVTARVDELGRRTEYVYDALDRLQTTNRPDGRTETVSYDKENRRTSTTDAANRTTTYQYDNVGRLTITTHPDNTTSQTTYDLAGRVVATTDELGHSTTTGYDDAGRRTSVTDATGVATTFAYDAAGNQVSSMDGLGRPTVWSYDGVGRRVATSFADGATQSSVFDAAGRLVAKLDELGKTTSFGYDAVGRLVTVTDALGKVTTYGYDEVGNRLTQKDANGQTTSFAFDARGRQTRRTLPDGSFEAKTYDAVGQLASRRDFMGRTTTYGYDALGRLLTRTYPDTSVVSFTYTPNSKRETATDARGVTRYTYDARDRLIALAYPDGRELDYGYDARGARTTLTTKIGVGSWTTTTAYDDAGRVTGVADPAGRWTTMDYDGAGQRTSLAYPNTATTSYGYDLRGRVKTIDAVGSGSMEVTSFAYTVDAAGRRTRVEEAWGTTRTYGYDSVDRLTNEMVTGTLNYGKAFTYDAVGNRLTQVTTGTGAGSVSYTYDNRDRLLTETGATYAYNANGDVTSKSGEATYGWDYEDRLTNATLTNGSTVTHAYDVDGNRVQTVAPTPAPPALGCQGNSAVFTGADATTKGTWLNAYGTEGRYINGLTAVPPSYGSVAVTNATNYTWTTNTSDVRALQQSPPQPARIASTYYSTTSETFRVVTNDGNAHTVAFYLLDWDALGRAETITAQTQSGSVLAAPQLFSGFSGGVYAVYTVCGSVDFVVNRTAGTNAAVSGVFFGPATPAVTTNMLVDTNGGLSQVVAESDGTSALTALYVRAGDELLAVLRPTGNTWSTRWVHSDAVGSVRALTDEAGVVAELRGYEAFGTMNAQSGTDPLPYRFAGEPFEGASKLAYHRARWMDPRLARFDGMDPFGGILQEPRTLHAYSYAGNDPLNLADASGRTYTLSGIAAGIQGRATMARMQIGAAFATGGKVLGSMFQEFGKIGEAAVSETLELMKSVNPAIITTPNVRVAGKRVVDFFVEFGPRAIYIESKYSFPAPGSAAFTRMVGQLSGALADPRAQQVWLFLMREPTRKQLQQLYEEVGTTNVEVVVGVEELWPALRQVFGPLW